MERIGSKTNSVYFLPEKLRVRPVKHMNTSYFYFAWPQNIVASINHSYYKHQKEKRNIEVIMLPYSAFCV
jgi:hypothetical protein